jgi:hypothetical protein
MPKDPVRNVDRYKIRGGHLNEFDYSRQQTEIAREQGDQQEHGGKIPITSEQTKADRIRQLLHKYGESVPGEPKKEEPPKEVPKAEPARKVKVKTVEKPPEKARAARKAAGETKKAAAKPVKKAAAKATKAAKSAKRSTAKAATKPAAKAASKKATAKSPARAKASKAARGASTGKMKSSSKGKKTGSR